MASKLRNHLRSLNTTGIRRILHHRFLNSANATWRPLNARWFSNVASQSHPVSPIEPSASSPPALLQYQSSAKAEEVSSPSSCLKDMELAKFAAIAETWKDPYSARPLEGLKIVDVGCGGGILSEPLAQMGATVTGIDAVEKNIKIARLADLDPTTSTIEFCCTTAEKLVEEGRKFDAVMALEVIEHVADPAELCKSLAALTIPDGATVISTINRSMRSYAAAIVAAEYILHWLPKGTHQLSSFLTPEELLLILQRTGINPEEMAGFVYNPLTGRWSLSDDISVNFVVFGTKHSA